MNVKVIFVALLLVFGSSYIFCSDIYLKLTSHGSRTDIGISEFIDTTSQDGAGKELSSIIRRDLLLSRYFNLIDGGPAYTGQFEQLGEWENIGVDLLVAGKITQIQNKQVLYASLSDTLGKTVIWQSSYVFTSSMLRECAHNISDEIIFRLVGERGIASTKIVFANNSTGSKELYCIDYDGHGLKQLTFDSSIAILPKWSADKSKIVYTTYRDVNPDIAMLTLATMDNVIISKKQGINTAAIFSPDDQSIALTQNGKHGPNLYLINLQGKLLRQLTFEGKINTSPTFSPSAKEIAFISDRGGYPQLYIMNLDGVNVRKVPLNGYCDSPRWSPRGNKIVFSMLSGTKNYELYVFDMKSNDINRLTYGTTNAENPSWSADGRFIVYSEKVKNKSLLFVISLDGTFKRLLSNIKGSSVTPDWSN